MVWKRAVLPAVAIALTVPSCGDDGEAAICDLVEDPVVLPDESRRVLDRVLTPAPELVDVLLRPWSLGDTVVHMVVFLDPARGGDVGAVAEDLRAANVDVTEVIGADEAAAGDELLAAHGLAPDSPTPAWIRVQTVGAAEAERVRDAVAGDERVASVVAEPDARFVWARFAPIAYGDVAEALDRLEEESEGTFAADLAELRALAGELDPSDPDAVEEAARAANRVGNFIAEECGIIVEDA